MEAEFDKTKIERAISKANLAGTGQPELSDEVIHDIACTIEEAGAQMRRCQNSQPRSSLFLSGVTPLSRVLHHFPGSVMLPKWCNAP